MFSRKFDGIGTTWEIRTRQRLDPVTGAILDARVEEFDRCYSRFRADSLVTRIAATAGVFEFPDDAVELFDFYQRLYNSTNGAVTPMVGRTLEQLGYDADYSLRRRPGRVAIPRWPDVLAVQGNRLAVARPVLLDFGAAGKGYLVDILGALLGERGYDDYLVDGSGDLKHRGDQSCRIGLEHPADPSRVVGVANVANAALCASAVNRRRWGVDLHHIIDPATGEPVTEVVATWVVASSAMVADGLATALFLTDPAALARDFSFSYVRLMTAGGIEYSTNFDGEMFV